jgi:hypothetical protein
LVYSAGCLTVEEYYHEELSPLPGLDGIQLVRPGPCVCEGCDWQWEAKAGLDWILKVSTSCKPAFIIELFESVVLTIFLITPEIMRIASVSTAEACIEQCAMVQSMGWPRTSIACWGVLLVSESARCCCTTYTGHPQVAPQSRSQYAVLSLSLAIEFP